MVHLLAFNILSSPALIALSLIFKNSLSEISNFPPEISTPSFPQLIKLQFFINPTQKSASNASENVFSILIFLF